MTQNQLPKTSHHSPFNQDEKGEVIPRSQFQQNRSPNGVDSSLVSYRRSLISEQAQFLENQEPEIEVLFLQIYDSGKLVYSSSVNQEISLRLGEQKLYEIQVCLFVKKAIVYGLTISNSIYKSIIRLSKEQYRQGTYAPNPEIQTARFSMKTPGGVLGRGYYRGESSIRDKHSKIYFELKYQVQIVQNFP